MQDLLLSGVKPTSMPHIGNYIGAIKQWKELQHLYPCLFFIADLHAITVHQDPQELRTRVLDTAAVFLAAGIDPKRSTLFVQSEVPEHAELMWMLMTIAKMGEMERMTQFKDKSQKEGVESAGVGLFSYPILMAADVLLYDSTVVPVGEDQQQHLEMARDLAARFNHKFGETFVLPKALLQTSGARVMSLQHPEKKMSKSDESKLGTIELTDDADTIRHKIKRAVTDTEGVVRYDEDAKPAISNLMSIYHHMSGQSMESIEAEFAGKNYGAFKEALAEVVVSHITPIGARITELLNDKAELGRLLDAGRDHARSLAQAKMQTVRERMGLQR